jgi:hypothetical protein
MYIRSTTYISMSLSVSWAKQKTMEKYIILGRITHLIRLNMVQNIAAWHGKGWRPSLVSQSRTQESEGGTV